MKAKYFFSLLRRPVHLLVLSGAVMTAPSVAQNCALTLEPTRLDLQTVVVGVSARAVHQDSKKIHSSVLRRGRPYFARLPEGTYRITASKLGYKRTQGDLSLSCSEGSEGVTAFVPLWKGSSRQIETDVAFTDPSVPRRTGPFVLGPTTRNAPPPEDSDYAPPSPPEPRRVPEPTSLGVLNGKAISLPRPDYPPAARAVKATGLVRVEVNIDEEGNVVSASAVSGHPLLRDAAVKAARSAKFSPTVVSGVPVSVTGIVHYNFVP